MYKVSRTALSVGCARGKTRSSCPLCTEEIRRKKNNLRLGILELYISEVGGFSPALEQAMRNAKQSRHVIPIPTVESDRHLSQRLFAMLSRLLTKRSHKLLRSCESNNGLEAYRQLCLNYGSETDEKGTTGLMFEIISFKFGSEIGEVADLLTEFKLKIKQHDEAPSTEPVPDAVIKTVLVNNVPEPLGSKTGTILGSQRAVNVPIPSTKIVG